MSDMEYHKGKLRKAFNKEMSFEEGINILKEKYNIDDIDIDIGDEYIYSDKIHWINDTWYEVIEHKQFDPDNMLDYNILPNGDIEFVVSFYNGGCSFSEVLTDLIDSANK